MLVTRLVYVGEQDWYLFTLEWPYYLVGRLYLYVGEQDLYLFTLEWPYYFVDCTYML